MTPDDLQRIRSSADWGQRRVRLFHDTSVGSEIVKRQRAARAAWRYRPLDGFARAAGLPPLKAVPAHGGAHAQGIEAQARDWLAYLHASALAFRSQLPAPRAECVALLRAEVAREPAPVRRLVADAARRLRWLLRLPAGDGRGWLRHISILQTAEGLMLAAGPTDANLARQPKVTHARHH